MEPRRDEQTLIADMEEIPGPIAAIDEEERPRKGMRRMT